MTADPAWRLFVAVPVPAHVRVLLEAAAAPARDAHPELTWTRPEGWHLTLAFLGDVPVDRVTTVEDVVASAIEGIGPIECRIDGADRFRSSVLWANVRDDPAGAIADLGARIQSALAAAHLPVNRQEVRPHLTLARASNRGGRINDAVVASVAPVDARWEADAVELVRSHLGDGPARYETLATWSLG